MGAGGACEQGISSEIVLCSAITSREPDQKDEEDFLGDRQRRCTQERVAEPVRVEPERVEPERVDEDHQGMMGTAVVRAVTGIVSEDTVTIAEGNGIQDEALAA